MTKAILFGAKHTLKLKSVDVKITFFSNVHFQHFLLVMLTTKYRDSEKL